MSRSKILIIVGGSIAAYKACELMSALVQKDYEVQSVLTPAGHKFLGESTLEGLTGRPVASALFSTGTALDHIQLTRWADLVIVCPATADLVNRFAAGLADDLAGACFLARDASKPWIIAPAMNPAMWSHPATLQSVARLRDWGIVFAPVGAGRTACGETGVGRLADVETVLTMIESALVPKPPRKRVLVTSGGTSERVDSVRVLTNTSTGTTGALLAARFQQENYEVTLLRSGAAQSVQGVEERQFFSYEDLDQELSSLLNARTYDLVIHAAAVGDFAVDRVEIDGAALAIGLGKIASHTAPVIHLKPRLKLLDSLRSRSTNLGVRIVAFKLFADGVTHRAATSAMQWLEDGTADLVVVNNLALRQSPTAFPSDLYTRGRNLLVHCATREDLAREVVNWFAGTKDNLSV